MKNYKLIVCLFVAAMATSAFAQEQSVAYPSAESLNVTPDPKSSKFHQRELEATKQPIRPGMPGETPFWNKFTKRFMYAPAFDFNKVNGAVKYKFMATDEAGKTHTFTADAPWAPLTPVWNNAMFLIELDGDLGKRK